MEGGGWRVVGGGWWVEGGGGEDAGSWGLGVAVRTRRRGGRKSRGQRGGVTGDAVTTGQLGHGSWSATDV